jgi:DNA polymerase II small subunit
MNQDVLDYFIDHDVLISPDVEDTELTLEEAKQILSIFNDELDVLNEDVLTLYKQRKGSEERKLTITKSHEEKGRERTFQDFVKTFNKRYEHARELLRNRNQMGSLSSAARIKEKERGTDVSMIGMVREKRETRNGNLIFEFEDKTGTLTALMKPDSDPELFETGTDMVLDEVVGINGAWLGGILFIKEIIFPDVPRGRALKKSPEESYVAFLGDPHFGAEGFLYEEFKRFLKWTHGELGNKQQRHIANNLEYIICPGDVVEGAGIYPGQEEDLAIEEVKDQYKEAAKWLAKIPDHIEILIIPGNHDVGRLAEPQHTIPKKYAPELWELPNVQLASNPCTVKFGKTDDFPGFTALIYHGGSLIYYSEEVPSIRKAGGQKRCDKIMKFLLERRHLAPTHGSTPYVPSEEDHLFIEEIPDFFVTGHIHRAEAAKYRNVTLINASTWIETTQEQIKRGLEPQPCRVPIVNLQTREMKMMNFLTAKTKKEEAKKLEQATEA